MTAQTYAWRGVDDPDRIDRATIAFTSEGMRAFGTATSADFATVWQLDVDRQWTTRALLVSARGLLWSRSLELTRDEHGRWDAAAVARGDSDLPPPGLADPRSVDGALDCDLGLCPVTNTMPIRRLGLVGATVAPTPLTMAWVEVPSLRVLRSDQVYSSRAEGKQIRYGNSHRGVVALLTVDDDGVVVDYPDLATRLADQPN